MASLPPGEDESWSEGAQRAFDAKVKPTGALGRLETIGCRLSSLQRTLAPRVDPARVNIFAGDHGVVREGVSAYPARVTQQMMAVYANGGAAISVLGRSVDAEVEVIDVGVDADLSGLEGVVHAKVRRGTRNLRTEPALTPDECAQALVVGRNVARRARDDGIQVLCLGDMGIGNTTAAAALCAALTGTRPAATVGPGAGVEGERLARKRTVVQDAVARVRRDGITSPKGLLAQLGGLEIAAITGATLEASSQNIAVVVDGFISTVGVLAAAEMEPSVLTACFFAHRSPEPGHAIALDAVEGDPLLDLDLRLGEGTGAAMALPILRAAADILREMDTFEDTRVEQGPVDG